MSIFFMWAFPGLFFGLIFLISLFLDRVQFAMVNDDRKLKRRR